MAEELKKSEVKHEAKAEAKVEKAEAKDKGFDAFGRKMNADGSFETDKDGNVVREWEWVRSDAK
jgi:hypothetical protein